MSSDDRLSSIATIDAVSREFGDTKALRNVTLHIPRGGVFGLIGENGAGKTTLIKHLLGLLRAQQGQVRVFGLDPVQNPVETLSRIGYLSEDRDLPEQMTVTQLMQYTQAFYPQWDERYAEQLRDDFELSGSARIKSLSRGQRARAGLLVALAHRPEFLILDEPSSGLDPVVRRDILAAIIRTIADDGRTVLFSSHLLDEVERVADRVAMIHKGEIRLIGSMDEIKQRHRRMTLRFERPMTAAPSFGNDVALDSGSGREWTYVCRSERTSFLTTAQELGATIVDDAGMTLDEIFVSQIVNGRVAV